MTKETENKKVQKTLENLLANKVDLNSVGGRIVIADKITKMVMKLLKNKN